MQRYAITDRSMLGSTEPEREQALLAQVVQWVEAGIEWIQLREKDLAAEHMRLLARRVADRAGGSGTKLVINSMPAREALGCGADGVHLPGSTTSPGIEAALALGAIVTVSCHTLSEIEAARDAGAAAALWAPVFGKTMHGAMVQPGTGLAALQRACLAAASMPVFALGGVTTRNAPACVEAGAAGVAGIRIFQSSPVPSHAEQEWQRLKSLQ
ncbi:thiamine phosphate synthase [Acidipila sp. EB88]|uniref:thiamine phosphate synthase n=1 Tax=Acidipila sp. EB88 TaxID=2305226 RepID=UPI000F5EF7CC|nr:thiamine phosphate synthase [Acidipila sp. EB88]RRA48376.1 thiamine phosphate synthase [Acidipila sp. EB88]